MATAAEMMEDEEEKLVTDEEASAFGRGASSSDVASMSDFDEGKVVVVCRFRPQNRREMRKGGKLAIKTNRHEPELVRVVDPEDTDNTYEFRFDHVFPSSTNQDEIYHRVGTPLVKAVLEGFNGTVFAYGQTGSGKTFTMEGPSVSDETRCGMIPRMTLALFDGMKNAPEHIKYNISISMLEIYMERVNDLLDPSKLNLAIREDSARGIWVEGCRTETLKTPDAILDVIKRGQQNRSTASTKMNSDSSRSHSLVIVNVEQNNLSTNTQLQGKMTLVDLAGSEKVRKSGSTGARLEEAKTINKSLSTLGNVINALTDDSVTYTPYRDSKLTRILQESLGGNSKTALIMCASPSSIHFNETLSTLRFGSRAKLVRNEVRPNQLYSPSELRSLLTKAQRELAQLRTQVPAAMKNPSHETTRENILKLVTSADQRRLQAEITELENALLKARSETTKHNVRNSELAAQLKSARVEIEQQELDFKASLAKEAAIQAQLRCHEDELRKELASRDDEIKTLRQELAHAGDTQDDTEARVKLQIHKLKEKELELRRERERVDSCHRELEKLNLELVRLVEARSEAAKAHKAETDSLRRASEQASNDHALSFKLISSHFEESREELKNVKERLADREAELASKTAQIAALQDALAESKGRENRQLASAGKASERAGAQIVKLQEDLMRATSAQKLLRKTLDQVKTETERHRIELEGEIADLQKTRRELDEETQASRAMFKHNLVDGASRVSLLLQELESAQNALVSSASASAATEAKLKTAISSLEKELAQTKSEADASRQELAKHKSKATGEIEKLSRQVQDHSEKAAQLQETLQVVQRDHKESKKNSKQLKTEVERLRSLEKERTEQIDNLEVALKNARKLCLEHAQKEANLKSKYEREAAKGTEGVSALKEELAAAQQKVEAFRKSVKTLEAEVDHLRGIEQKSTVRIKELEAALKEALASSETHETKLQVVNKELRILQRLRPVLEQELKTAKQECSEYEVNAKSLQNEVDKLSALEEQRSVQILVLEQRLADSQERSSEHASRTKEMQEEVNELNAHKKATAKQLKKLRKELETFKTKDGEQSDSFKNLQEEVHKLRSADDTNVKRIKELETLLSQERQLSEDHHDRQKELKAQLAALQESRSSQVAELQKRLDATEQEYRAHAISVSSLKSEVQELREREGVNAAQVNELEASLAHERELTREFKAKEERLQAQLKDLEAQQADSASDLKDQLQAVQREHQAYAENVQCLQAQIQELRLRDDENYSQIRSLEESLAGERELSEDYKSKAMRLASQLSSLEEKQASDLEAFQDELRAAKKQHQEKERSTKSLEAQAEDLRARDEENASRIEHLEKTLAHEQTVSRGYKDKMLDLQTQLAVLEEKHADVVSKFERDMQAAKAQNQEQEVYVETLRSEVEQLRSRSADDASHAHQAERALADQELRLSNKLIALERENAELQDNLDEFMEKHREQDESTLELQAKIDELSQADEQSCAQMQDLQQSLNSAHKLNREYAEKLKAVTDQLTSQNEQQNAQIMSLQQELQAVEGDYRLQVQRTKGLEAQVLTLSSSSAHDSVQFESLQRMLDESQRMCTEHERRETDFKEEVRRLGALEAEKSARVRALQQELARVQDELTAAQSNSLSSSKFTPAELAARGTTEAAELAKVLQKSQDAAMRHEQTVSALQHELTELRAANAKLESEVNALLLDKDTTGQGNALAVQSYVDALARADAEKASAHERIAELKCDLESAVANCASLRAARDAATKQRMTSVHELQEHQQVKLDQFTQDLQEQVKRLQGEKAVLEAQVWERNEQLKSKARSVQTSLLHEVKALDKPCTDLLSSVNKFISSVKTKENTIADIRKQCSRKDALDDAQRERYEHIVAGLKNSLDMQHNICDNATADVHAFKARAETIGNAIRERMLAIRDSHFANISDAARRVERATRDLLDAEHHRVARGRQGKEDDAHSQELAQHKAEKLAAEDVLARSNSALDAALDHASLEFRKRIQELRHEEEAARRDLHEKLQSANRCQSELIQSLSAFDVKDIAFSPSSRNKNKGGEDNLRAENERLRQLVEIQEAKIERRNRRLQSFEERVLKNHEEQHYMQEAQQQMQQQKHQEQKQRMEQEQKAAKEQPDSSKQFKYVFLRALLRIKKALGTFCNYERTFDTWFCLAIINIIFFIFSSIVNVDESWQRWSGLCLGLTQQLGQPGNAELERVRLRSKIAMNDIGAILMQITYIVKLSIASQSDDPEACARTIIDSLGGTISDLYEWGKFMYNLMVLLMVINSVGAVYFLWIELIQLVSFVSLHRTVLFMRVCFGLHLFGAFVFVLLVGPVGKVALEIPRNVFQLLMVIIIGIFGYKYSAMVRLSVHSINEDSKATSVAKLRTLVRGIAKFVVWYLALQALQVLIDEVLTDHAACPADESVTLLKLLMLTRITSDITYYFDRSKEKDWFHGRSSTASAFRRVTVVPVSAMAQRISSAPFHPPTGVI
ncbi:Kinesin-related protein 3 [Hondaea fermentalgiana]|uniref:Kinesin-related protein 3 n=1 Tax=Hondaea fermentalgiana TaxID=2315210 RepID=A0A2R5G643_9STRA|nr:Kinesin-related protein 3 [Hondaea fermentalgiana]|eukprot:GBG25799.1 Kinesin-related protein 3 [Hondaea fermentalgiana]